MRIILILVAVICLIVLVTQGLRHIFESKSSLWRTVLNKLGGAFLIIGGIGLLGSGLSSVGGMNWLPNSFEWPLSGTHSALRFSSGEYAVSHTAVDRIQIYNEKMQFINGWQIDAQGGEFYLLPSQQASLYAFTVKGSKKFEYDLLGNLISSSTYEDPLTVGNDSREEIQFKVNPLLWPFSGPFAGWTICLVGALFLAVPGIRKTR